MPESRPPADGDRAAVPGDPMSGPVVAPAGPWNIANGLTGLRLLLVPLFAWLLLREDGADELSRTLAFVTFAVAMGTDKVDGDLARRRGLETSVGAIADPIADKALTGAAFVGLSLLGELPWWVTVVVLVREIGVTVLRFVVIRHGVIPASRGGKAKTSLQAVAVALYLLPLPSSCDPVTHAAMGAAVLVTVLTGVDYVFRAWSLWRGRTR